MIAARIIASALIIVVITQLTYVALGGSGQMHIAYPIWRIEALAALVVTLFGFVIVMRNPLAGGCLVLAGLCNLIQTGIGLSMFYQLGYGSGSAPNPVFMPVLGFSFFLYFAAKAAIGVAGVVLGTGLWRGATGLWRLLGGAAVVVGLAALLLNGAAMSLGLGQVPLAGAAGATAAFLVALVLLRMPAAHDAA
ncbi:MAG TPA: hypothetical protein VLA45_16205 [Paracoccaceae bacterium]|nr:hypothetical protein [Paracoccaceae bacterium]